MKMKEFKNIVKQLPDDAEILFSCDEEMNTLRKGGEIAVLSHNSKMYVIYGFDGTECDFDG